MPSRYRSGESIPRCNGVIRGGTTIVIDELVEIGELKLISENSPC